MKPPIWLLHPKTYAKVRAKIDAEQPEVSRTSITVSILVRESDLVPEGEMWEISEKGDLIKRYSLIKGEIN